MLEYINNKVPKQISDIPLQSTDCGSPVWFLTIWKFQRKLSAFLKLNLNNKIPETFSRGHQITQHHITSHFLALETQVKTSHCAKHIQCIVATLVCADVCLDDYRLPVGHNRKTRRNQIPSKSNPIQTNSQPSKTSIELNGACLLNGILSVLSNLLSFFFLPYNVLRVVMRFFFISP